MGYENATPTELPRVRTIHNGLTIHDAWVRTIHNKWRAASSSISYRVAKAERPHPNPPPKRVRATQLPKLSRNELHPLGEDWGGASTSSCFCTGVSRTFFTVVTAGVMQSMTVVMVPMPRRKTCFPIGIGDSTAKAKLPAVATAFCVYFIPFGDEQMKSHSGRPAISSNSAGVAITQPRVAGEARYPGYI